MALTNSYTSMQLLKKLFPSMEDFNKNVIENPRNLSSVKDRADLYGDKVSKFLSEASSDFNMGWGTVLTIPGFSTDRSGYIQIFLPASTIRSGGTLIYRISQSSSMQNGWTDWFEIVVADNSPSQLVNLDVGLSSPFYQLEDGLRVTKERNVVHLNGGLQHGINLKYQNIAKVPPGYEPKYKTPLHGFYSKASGEFVSIPLLLKPDGYIVMMGDRNDPATPTNMYVSGTWNIKS